MNPLKGRSFDDMTPVEQLNQKNQTNRKLNIAAIKFAIEDAMVAAKNGVLIALGAVGLNAAIAGTALAKDDNMSYDISGYTEEYKAPANPLFVSGGVRASNRNTSADVQVGNENFNLKGNFGEDVQAGMLSWQINSQNGNFFKSSSVVRAEDVEGRYGDGNVMQYVQGVEFGGNVYSGNSFDLNLSGYASIFHTTDSKTLGIRRSSSSSATPTQITTTNTTSTEKFRGGTFGNTGVKLEASSDWYSVYGFAGPSFDKEGLGVNAGVGAKAAVSDNVYFYSEATAIVLNGKSPYAYGEAGIGVQPTNGVDFRLGAFGGRGYRDEGGVMATASITTDRIAEIFTGKSSSSSSTSANTTRRASSSSGYRVVSDVPTTNLGYRQTVGQVKRNTTSTTNVQNIIVTIDGNYNAFFNDAPIDLSTIPGFQGIGNNLEILSYNVDNVSGGGNLVLAGDPTVSGKILNGNRQAGVGILNVVVKDKDTGIRYNAKIENYGY